MICVLRVAWWTGIPVLKQSFSNGMVVTEFWNKADDLPENFFCSPSSGMQVVEVRRSLRSVMVKKESCLDVNIDKKEAVQAS